MSDVSFSLEVPPVPLPLISPDEGVPSVPGFQPYSYGSIGESTTGYDVPPSRPNQIGYDGGSETIGHPFKVLQAASKVTVNPGLVNGITITNNEINNISGTNNFVVLDIVVNSNGVSSVSLDIQSSAPNGIDFVKNGVSTSFSYPIAIVDNDRIVAQLVFNNLFFTPRIAYEEPKTSVSVGEYPNDIYYSWEATNA